MSTDEWTRAAAKGGAVLIPVKAFDRAKSRLAPALDPDGRTSLAQRMATHVIEVQGATPVAVACDDDLVASWATDLGARVVWCPDTDLNGAVDAGYRELTSAGVPSIAIAHSDLPGAKPLAPLLGWPGVTILPDRHRTGTNVMILPAGLDFEFAYGSGSFRLHVVEAVRHRCGLRIVHDRELAWDIDHPEDLDTPDAQALLRSANDDTGASR
ncbi:MAG: 2-phospho-L-lactate guanylyltransferase [Actinomycetota bacterium]